MRVLHRSFSPGDLVGGHWVVDFVNAAPGRDTEPRDWLDGYGRLLEWAGLTGALGPDDLAALEVAAKADPVGAEAALERARALREALFEAFAALAAGRAAPQPALELIAARWRQAVGFSRLQPTGRGVGPRIDAAAAGLDTVSAAIALAAVELMEHGPMPRLKLCEGHDCAWLFLDTSKNGRRRWCSMATCGNSAKARRHYQKRRAELAG